MAMTLVQYFKLIPQRRKKSVEEIHAMIMKLYPKMKVDMQYKMPTYYYKEGWIALANQKNYISLYTCGYHHIEEFKKQHPGIKTGKGCINFRESDKIPLEALKNVVKHAIEHPKI